MNNYLKTLITENNNANTAIKQLEEVVAEYEIKTPKDKANFANLCILLRAKRMASEATEALLFNENVVVTDNDEYYQKIAAPSTEDCEDCEQANSPVKEKADE